MAKRKSLFSPILLALIVLVVIGGVGALVLQDDPKAEIKDLKSMVQVSYGAKKHADSVVQANKGLVLAQKTLGNKHPDTLYFAQALSEAYIQLGDKKNAAAALTREIDLRLAAGQTEAKLQPRRTYAIKFAQEIGDRATATKHAIAVAKGIDMGPGKDPQPVYRTDTKYPPEQFNKGIEGDVVIAYDLDANGTVLDAKIDNAKPALVFDNAALQSFKEWRFTPMIENGMPVPSSGHKFTLMFRLGGQSLAPKG